MRRLLALNFFPAFTPPSSGGEMRYFNLYQQLSKQFDVTLLSPTYSNHSRELLVHSASFREHRIPKDPHQDQLYAKVLEEGLAAEVSALVCALSAGRPSAFHEAFLELQADADVIVHESPYMLDYDMLLGLDSRPRIYNSYNVESDLVSQMWKGPVAPAYLERILSLEGRLIDKCSMCFAVSEAEATRFSGKFGKPPACFRVVENGISIDEFHRSPRTFGRPTALFFGSLHPPNIEAACFIRDVLAPSMPEIDFVIAGNCLSEDGLGLPSNVRALGKVSNEARLELFATADIAINPMFSGSGTNLKALEFLAAGIPMVTTSTGARGLGIVDDQHALIVGREGFAQAVRRLTENPAHGAALAAAGRAHTKQNFSWDAIGARAATYIDSCVDNFFTSRKRRILLLNDFAVSKPNSGGEVRINQIYRGLAANYEIALACLSSDGTVRRVDIAPGFVELQIPRTAEHRRRESDFAWRISAGDIVTYLEAPGNRLLATLVAALYRFSDVVVLSHPYMVGLLDGLEGLPVVYEAHNVETELKRSLLIGHPAYIQLVRYAEACERAAIARSVCILIVADAERAGLMSLGARDDQMRVVQNGVNVPRWPVQPADSSHLRAVLGGRSSAIFIGSAHPPNVEAASFIIGTLAPQMPELLFLLIGSVCEAFGSDCPPNVIRLGRLEDEEKDIAMELADIAINPMVSGSGSNLKLAEYFSKSRPTISTEFGARGYAITSEVEALICDLDEFPARIRRLLADPVLRCALGERAFAYAKEKLDWQFSAREFRNLLEDSVFKARKRNLLVVTHRFTDPPLGGAETYLFELLHQLAQTNQFSIDVATTDIVRLENQYHFSCIYERSAHQSDFGCAPNTRVLRFPVVEQAKVHRLESARCLWKIWMDEFRRASLRHLDSLPNAILLGGWYYPERSGTRVSIWSSPCFLIRARELSSICLRGYSPQQNVLRVLCSSEKTLHFPVNGDFQIEIPTQESDVLEMHVGQEYQASDDPRDLGVLVTKIECCGREGTFDLALDVNYRDALRNSNAEAFIQSLVHGATSRDDSTDRLFQDTRGPNSPALEHWLDENVDSYDLIIGHCVPFKTVVMAARAAEKHGTPLVQIPHFHIDDEFYHWDSYYRALRQAKLCITHPQAATPLLFDRIGVKSYYFPFGVAPDARPSAEDETQFRKAYPSDIPFVLVLGRKDRAKNYMATVAAVGRLKSDGHACNVILIGRDEDGESLDPERAIYLGGQATGVVLAAIRACVCLVTMSESESFGIVILEAWAQGRAAIVNERCLASVELVTDGIDGLHANSRDLDLKILRLLRDPEEAVRLGENGRRKLSDQFTWAALGDRLSNLLLSLSLPA